MKRREFITTTASAAIGLMQQRGLRINLCLIIGIMPLVDRGGTTLGMNNEPTDRPPFVLSLLNAAWPSGFKK